MRAADLAVIILGGAKGRGTTVIKTLGRCVRVLESDVMELFATGGAPLAAVIWDGEAHMFLVLPIRGRFLKVGRE